MSFRNGFYAGLVVALVWGVYLARLWQAPRQIELHSIHLLARIEQKNWTALGEFVAPEYQDRWGNDRARLLERLHEIFRYLPQPQIEFSGATVRVEDGRGYWTARITLKGSGEFTDAIENRLNGIQSPFELEWQRGAWPWDWKLVAVRNPDLQIPDESR